MSETALGAAKKLRSLKENVSQDGPPAKKKTCYINFPVSSKGMTIHEEDYKTLNPGVWLNDVL